MARNTLAGTTKGQSKSAKYFRANPKAKAKKDAYNKKYHATPERKKYRAQLQKKNRSAGTHGNKDGKDYDHKDKKTLKLRGQSANRADKSKKVFKKKK